MRSATPAQISFLANPKYQKLAEETNAAAVIVAKKRKNIKCAQIICPNPYLAFAKLLAKLHPPPKREKGVHSSAVLESRVELGENISVGGNVYLGKGCKIGENTVIMPNVFIGADTVIGNDCLIYPNVTIRERVVIGERVIIHSGAVIGSDGFGYAADGERYYKIPQIGSVLIEDEVEIGSNVSIDRATLGRTVISKGCKIDNLVQIAHNVEIGENTVLVAQMGIAGSSRIGKHCTIAGQVGIVGHITIGDNVVVAGQSGVTKDLAGNQIVLGSPAIPITQERRQIASRALLPETMKKLKIMEERLAKLESQASLKKKEDCD